MHSSDSAEPRSQPGGTEPLREQMAELAGVCPFGGRVMERIVVTSEVTHPPGQAGTFWTPVGLTARRGSHRDNERCICSVKPWNFPADVAVSSGRRPVSGNGDGSPPAFRPGHRGCDKRLTLPGRSRHATPKVVSDGQSIEEI